MARLVLLLSIPLGLSACQAQTAAPAPPSARQASTAVAPAAAPTAYHLAACYPHDPDAFTQGLIWLDGALYEGTGIEGRSTLRMVRLEDGAVLRSVDLPPDVFGEGIVNWGDEILSITWRSQRGFRWKLDDFTPAGTLSYTGEGWGLTEDGTSILMSDGSARIAFRDPDSFAVEREIIVRFNGAPVTQLNELEYVDGAILANIWQTDFIVRIDPQSGDVTGVYDLSPISAAVHALGPADVLNGIADDPATGRLFVTGKDWPLLFELRPGSAPASGTAPCAALPSLRWSGDGGLPN